MRKPVLIMHDLVHPALGHNLASLESLSIQAILLLFWICALPIYEVDSTLVRKGPTHHIRTQARGGIGHRYTTSLTLCDVSNLSKGCLWMPLERGGFRVFWVLQAPNPP
jgi:hypothetical protein